MAPNGADQWSSRGGRRTRRAFLGTAAGGALGASAWARLPANFWQRRADVGGVGGELAELVRWVRELSPEGAIPGLVDRIRAGLAPESLLLALLHAGLADVRPQPVGFQFHCVLQLPAVWSGVRKNPVTTESWLPLGYALHQYLLLKARAKPGVGLPQAPEPALLPSAETAEATLEQALRGFDLEAGDAAVTALVRGGDRFALRRTLLPFAARNFTDVGHHPIFAAGAVELLEQFGWTHAEPLLRSLVRGLLLPGPSAACDDFARSREIAVAIAAREHPAVDAELLATLRLAPADAAEARFDLSTLPATPAAAQAALLGWLARSGGEGSQLFAGFAAVIDVALELLAENRGLLGVHALTSSAALYELAANQDVAERWTSLLQAAAWLPRWREAFGGARRKSRAESPLLADFESDLEPSGASRAPGASAATVLLERRGEERR
ncbi:MAG: hypothetical protein FJ293_17235, partial [Planctomycetes bacterium]|nr:hypothetical protein [Planctomycetota bacterium]